MNNTNRNHPQHATDLTGTALRNRLRDAGCFDHIPAAHMALMLAIILLYSGAFVLLLQQPDFITRLAALLLLAFCCVQAGFIAHDAGHRAITRKRWLIEAIGQFFNTFLTALCYSHFQKIHRCHHAHTNERENDIDMQSDLVSLYPQAKLKNTSRLGRFITRHQGWMIWPLISLQGLSLKIDSIRTLLQDPRGTRIDQLALLLHFLLWFGLPVSILGWSDAILNYALMTWFIGPYTGAVFLVNHIGTHIIEPGEKPTRFMQQLMTTRNVGDSLADDLFFGGVNNHIEHHLFPAIPSFRLRQARRIVREYCKEQGLEYSETNWWRAARDVSAYLSKVSREPVAGTK